MKGAIEYLVVYLLLMAGIIFSFNIYGIYEQNHRAHSFRDQVSSLIENYDGNLSQVNINLRENSVCNNCTYTISKQTGYYLIEVHYNLKLKVLNLNREMTIKGLSYKPSKSS